MPSQPAQPLLASTLFHLHKTRQDDNNVVHTSLSEANPVPRKRRKLETGWKEIDSEVLRGGLDYGEGGFVCLSAGGSGGGSGDDGEGLGDELAYSTLASHLLSTTSTSPSSSYINPHNPAFYIDTLGTFSPHRLHNLLCTRLRQPDFTHQGGYVYHKVDGLVGMTRTAADVNGKGDGENEVSVEEKAAKLLDRVKIMRCFDFRGLMECIGEVGSLLRELEIDGEDGGGGRGGSDASGKGRVADVADAVGEDAVETAAGEDAGETGVVDKQALTKLNAQAQARKLEILDSQADDFDDEDLLLDDYLVNLPHTTATNNNDGTHLPPPAPAHHHQQPSPPKPHHPQTLLILPSIPRLLSPMMHANHIRGHALLTHLLRSLRHLTSSHALCVLILNSVVGVPNPNIYHKQSAADEGVSVFAENGGMRPALGKTFAWGVDLSLMGSFVGGGGNGGGKRVVEVVGDRFGGRVGRWGVLG